MSYLNYLENFSFDSLLSTSFLLPFFGIIIVVKIISVIFFYYTDSDDDEPHQVTVFSNFLFYIIFSFSILTIYDYRDRKSTLEFRYSNNIILDDSESMSEEHDITSQNSQQVIDIDSSDIQSESFSWDNISITKQASDLIDNANLTEKYVGLTSDDIIKLKKIMSDPNPDPLSQSGQSCNAGSNECKWCGKEVEIPTKIYTSKDLLGLIVMPKSDNPLEILASVMTVLSVSPQACIESYESSNNSQRKYQCIITDTKEFCSLKCEKEFKYNRGY